MITITPDFSLSELDDIIDSDINDWFKDLGKSMMNAGKLITDKAIRKAKTGAFSGGGFGNISYDLRSSMGCGLAINKTITQTYFPFGRTGEGKQNGINLLNQVASELDEEIALIMVAGMSYAVFVQQKGYDVITMSFATFDPEFLKKLK